MTKLNTRKAALLKFLGPPYRELRIDYEPCVYHDLGPFDIEISGGMYRRPFVIFVWAKPQDRSPHIIHQRIVSSDDHLVVKDNLDEIVTELQKGRHFGCRCCTSDGWLENFTRCTISDKD